MEQLKRICLIILGLLALLGLIAVVIPSHSLSPRSNTAHESAATQGLTDSFREYQSLHSGMLATNWQQLGEVAHLDYLNYKYLGGRDPAPLQSNYVFITVPVALLPPHRRGEVVLIRGRPFKRTDPPGLARVVISRDGTNYHWNWLAEDQVQAAFKAANQIPPNVTAPRN